MPAQRECFRPSFLGKPAGTDPGDAILELLHLAGRQVVRVVAVGNHVHAEFANHCLWVLVHLDALIARLAECHAVIGVGRQIRLDPCELIKDRPADILDVCSFSTRGFACPTLRSLRMCGCIAIV